MYFTPFVRLQIWLPWSAIIMVGYEEHYSTLRQTIINISYIIKRKTYLIANCDVAWYCMWGTQLKANWFISWNFTYLLFFVPKQLEEVKTITFISASHFLLIILLLLIILQHTLKSHVFYLFTGQLHVTNKIGYPTTNDTRLAFSEAQYQPHVI